MRYPIRVPRAVNGLLAGILMLGLAACEEGALTSASPVAVPAAGSSSVEQDVERPDILSVTENALWDGRPSLGGIWVAYPGDIDPERVVITNVATGESVIGALFRRERDNPGPAIQISSDTASALGILAGNPTEVSIVVLRRETIEIAPPPEPEANPETTEAMELGAIVEEVLADVPVAAPLAISVPAPIAREPEIETVAIIAPPAPAGPPPSKPFIQIGTFSSEQNAKDLVTILGNEGVLAQIRTDTSGERTLYRVVSGPATSRAERNERLRIIKSLGFTDAFIFG